MKFETDRFIAQTAEGVAHVRFKSSDIVEYTEAVKLKSELRRMVGSCEFRILVVDCESLRFITSTVIDAIISTYLRCRKLERDVRIVHAEPIVREALQTAQIHQLIPIVDSFDEAVREP